MYPETRKLVEINNEQSKKTNLSTTDDQESLPLIDLHPTPQRGNRKTSRNPAIPNFFPLWREKIQAGRLPPAILALHLSQAFPILEILYL